MLREMVEIREVEYFLQLHNARIHDRFELVGMSQPEGHTA